MAQADSQLANANKNTAKPQYTGIIKSKTRRLFKKLRRAFAMPV